MDNTTTVIKMNDSVVLFSGSAATPSNNGTDTYYENKHGSSYIAAAIYLTIIGIIAVMGNGMVLLVILRDKKLRSKPHNYLLISMACCDIGVLFGGYPFTIISGYNQAWMFGDITCIFAGFFTYTLSLTNMNTLVALCVYRYIMICDPGKAFILTKRVTAYVIIGTWGYSLFWTCLPLVGWGAYGREPINISCSLDWANYNFSNVSYMVATIIFCYFTHVGIMVNCYRHISKTVAKLAARDRERERRVMGMEDILHQINVADDHQVTRMCFLVVLVFVGVWTPYALVCFVSVFYHDLPVAVTALPTMCAKAGCMLNPLVYFATNRKFRMKTLEMLGCVKQDNVVGVDVPKDVVRMYDKMSKDGVYLGRENIVVQQSSSMF